MDPLGFVFPSCSALIRPGRFDMQVTVPRPDVKGRTEILKLYLQKIKVDPGTWSHTRLAIYYTFQEYAVTVSVVYLGCYIFITPSTWANQSQSCFKVSSVISQCDPVQLWRPRSLPEERLVSPELSWRTWWTRLPWRLLWMGKTWWPWRSWSSPRTKYWWVRMTPKSWLIIRLPVWVTVGLF